MIERRAFLLSSLGATVGVGLDTSWCPGGEPKKIITTHNGWKIDSGFGIPETKLLTQSLAKFYERFVRYSRVRGAAGKQGVMLCEGFPYDDFLDYRTQNKWESYMIVQVNRIVLACITGKYIEPFPKITIRRGYEKGNWVARAQCSTMRVHNNSHRKDKSCFDGQFVITVNDYYLNNRNEGQHYSDVGYWAGTIAHELLHNLGHNHPVPGDASYANYHLYQMVCMDSAIAQNWNYEYGTKPSYKSCCSWTD
jgi:hypothetical protein